MLVNGFTLISGVVDGFDSMEQPTTRILRAKLKTRVRG